MLYGSIIALAVALIVVVFVAVTFNSLVTYRNRFLNAFSQIDVQLKRRYDLIPNLLEAVKGYMAHERQTFEAVTHARTAAMTAAAGVTADPTSAIAMQALVNAESNLVGALGRFRMLSEAYPDLKASTNAGALMEELSSTENRIAFARQAYNDAVMTYNTKRETFPTNLLAGMFGFSPATLFTLTNDLERQNVQVKL
jgi:LemA protein